jgi:hypothetical protein
MARPDLVRSGIFVWDVKNHERDNYLSQSGSLQWLLKLWLLFICRLARGSMRKQI